MYTANNYPVSMKNLSPDIRTKAIDIVNALLKDGMVEEDAIPISIAKAKESVQLDDSISEKEIYQETYVVYQEHDLWKVKKKQAVRSSSLHERKNDAIAHARLLAERYNAKIRIEE